MISSVNLMQDNYYDSLGNNYYKILTLNKLPNGELKKYVKLTSIKNVSTKINLGNDNYCSYVISKNILNNSNNLNNINSKIDICTIDDLSSIYDFLINNNYIINNDYINILRETNNKILLNFYFKN
jgi:hypothetical protein